MGAKVTSCNFSTIVNLPLDGCTAPVDFPLAVSPCAATRNELPDALNRENPFFAGSDEGGDNWAVIAGLIENFKISGINPRVWSTHPSPSRPPVVPPTHPVNSCLGPPWSEHTAYFQTPNEVSEPAGGRYTNVLVRAGLQPRPSHPPRHQIPAAYR